MKRFLAILLLVTITFLAACGGTDTQQTENNDQTEETKQTETNEGSFPISLTDATGEEVVINEEPEKLVSLIPSNTEIVFELGLGEKVVGVSDNDNYPEEVLDIEKIGGMEFNVEKILSLDPDLVLAHGSVMGMAEQGLQQLKDADVPVLVVHDATNFDELYDTIQMIGEATGTKEEAEELVTNMQKEIDEIKVKAEEVTEKKSVVFEVSPAPEIFVGGKNTFMDEILTIIGAENAIEEEGWPQLNEEAMIALNPDIIITTYGFYVDHAVEQVLDRKGWEDVTAIKEEQVYDVHSDLVTRPGPRLAEGVKELAKAIYPEVFSE